MGRKRNETAQREDAGDALLREEAAQHYREIGDNILALGARRQIKTLAVSSTVHGEGVSTVACNLAASLARNGAGEILLADANFRRPSLAQRFGIEGSPGLSDTILDGVEVGERITPTSEPHLFVLSAGSVGAQATQILASEGLKHLLEDTAYRFSLVIFDSAPIAPYRDTAVLSALVDGVLLVIEAERLIYQVIEKARDKIAAAGGSIIGAALNRRRYHIPEAIYRRL